MSVIIKNIDELSPYEKFQLDRFGDLLPDTHNNDNEDAEEQILWPREETLIYERENPE